MNEMTLRKPTSWFVAAGTLAVVLGGVISAFSAHQPSELAMWASAYLVLVAGVAQVGFGVCLTALTTKAHSQSLLWAAFITCNAANVAVLLGTVYKNGPLGHLVTDIGGITLIASLICMVAAAKHSRRSPLLRFVLYVVAIVLIVSIPIGLLLARQ